MKRVRQRGGGGVAVGVTVFGQSAPADLAYDANADLLQFPARRGRRCGDRLHGEHLHLHADGHAGTRRSVASGPSIMAIRGSSSSTRPGSS